MIIIMNEYYYSAVESKKLQEHLTTEKNRTSDSVTQDKNGVRLREIERAAEEQCVEPSFETEIKLSNLSWEVGNL